MRHCADAFQTPEEISLETEFEEGAAIRVHGFRSRLPRALAALRTADVLALMISRSCWATTRRVITGTAWSGPRFFALAQRTDAPLRSNHKSGDRTGAQPPTGMTEPALPLQTMPCE